MLSASATQAPSSFSRSPASAFEESEESRPVRAELSADAEADDEAEEEADDEALAEAVDWAEAFVSASTVPGDTPAAVSHPQLCGAAERIVPSRASPASPGLRIDMLFMR